MIGLSREEFWNLSLRELWSELIAARRRDERKRRDAMTQAWTIAALTRVKDFPPLAKLLHERMKPQTMTEQRTALMMIFGHSGKRVH